MTNSINYRFYLPGDEGKIVDLLRSNFPKLKLPTYALENWKWKYINSPFKSVIVVCSDADKIVGVVHEIIVQIKIGDSIFLCDYADDGAVSSEYRRRGVFDQLRKLLIEYNIKNGIFYSYFAADNPIIVKYHLNIGYRPFPFYISPMVRVKNVENFLRRYQKNNLFTNIGLRVIKGLNKIENAVKSRPRKINDFTIVEAAKFDDSVDAFWNQVKNSYDYIVEKKVDYLNWKINRPGRKHMLKMAVREDEVVGFIILEILENGDYLEGTISDLLVTPSRLDIADSLIEDACRYFDEKGVDFIYYAATKGHPYQNLAASHGLLDASIENNTLFYYRINNSGIDSDLIEKTNPTRVQLSFF